MAPTRPSAHTDRARGFVRRAGPRIGGGVVLLVVVAAMWNLDITERLLLKIQKGTFSRDAVSIEIESFDLGVPGSIQNSLRRVSPRDQMMQVFVPAGEFLMGESDHPEANHYPQHPVYLDAYWIDQITITNSTYALGMLGGSCSEPAIAFNPHYGKWAYRDYPVTYITWWQARAYCAWAGRRLPTEAEYEKAGRGPDARSYPWGNQNPSPLLANFGGLVGEALPALRYPAGVSPYGAFNMSGNVREWVWDWYAANYYERSPYFNPKGPDDGKERSLRGGSDEESAKDIAIYKRFNHDPLSAGLSRGFRCAQDAAPPG